MIVTKVFVTFCDHLHENPECFQVTVSNPWRIRIKELLPHLLSFRSSVSAEKKLPSPTSEVVIIKEYAKKFFKDTSILEHGHGGEFVGLLQS